TAPSADFRPRIWWMTMRHASCDLQEDFIPHSVASKPTRCFNSGMALLPLLFFAATAAQAAAAPVPSPLARPVGRPFISPMGEPFRPTSRDTSGLALWVAQADGNHDGRLTLDEMQADADRFFALLDVSHDGEIDPDDIQRYENDVAPEISAGSRFAASSGFDEHQGAARFGLLDLPEPVVAADSNFNRGVSLEEYRQAARQRFLALDLDHHGYLTLPELQKIRPAPPPRPKRTPGE